MISLFGFMNLNGQATDLFISEYIEGSGTYNKALELFNGTGSSVNLDTYSISIYTNGSSSASYTLALSGDLANNDVLVISRASADAQIQEVTDIEDASLNNFNGDDAIALLNNGIVIDVFGTIGVDPGSSWPLPGIGNNTKDHTLVRKSSVSSPNSTNSASFGTTTENSEWDVYEQNTFSFIGSHTFGATGNLAPVISNIVIDPETNIDYLETVSVSADVTDDDTVSSVVLNWGTTSGSLTNQITMNNSGSTYTTLSDIPAQAKSTTVYYQITATDNDSATSTSTEASYTVLSNVLPIITNIVQTPTANITSSTAVSISADITDNDGTINGAELHWGTSTGTLSNTIDMPPSSGDTYVTDSEVPVQLNGTTVYYEIYALDNDSGETTSSEQSYEVLDPLPLDADFFANSTNVYVDQEVTFTNATSGGSTPYSFSWNFGDSNTSTTENPTHTYGSTGTYMVKLTVTDANSASDTETKLGYITVEEAPAGATDLFFSEYIEGASGSNKALEIFNGTGSDVDLSAYSIKLAYNGQDWNNSVITLSGSLANNSVYTIGNDNNLNDEEILASDLLTGSLSFNGNDAVGLFKNDALVDIIGVYQVDPGDDEGWDVAGTEDATLDHVLVRKAHITQGNPDYWTLENGFGSAGTDVNDSEWIVYSNAYYTDFGSHNYAPLTVDFSADLTSTTAGTTIQFTANVSGGSSPYLYEWDFNNDGVAESTSANPSHIYNVAGTYSVSLYVLDNNFDERTLVKNDYITIASNIVYADDLIISEYVSGTGNNKSLEIYNGTGQTVDMSDYSIRISNPGGNWSQTIDLSGNLDNDAVFVLAHPSAHSTIANLANTTNINLTYNGKNAVGLFKSEVAIDVIGVPNALPAGDNDGWTVANIPNATASRTLVRKSNIGTGNTNPETWTGSVSKDGETTPDSEWIVFQQDSFGNLGNHDFDFGDETLPVTLTSFTSSMTYSGLGQAMVSIQWKTEAESGLIGYNVLRSMNPFYESAIRVNQEIVSANNSLVGNSYSYIDQNVQLHNNYYYWLESVELSNENETFGPIHIKVVGYNSDSVTVPYKTSLRSIYPNPFNPSTTVRFYVNTTDRVNIKVYNIRGQEIKQLTQEIYQPGFYKVIWNGKDENENRCASGIYLFKMETTRESQLIKGILVK
jgi:PKD repeat protein